MSDQPPRWWNKQIVIPFLKPRQRRPPSPFQRKLNRIFGSLLLVLFLSFIIWRMMLNFEINARLAKIHAAGLPVSGAELNLWQPVPDAENGAPLMSQAFALLRTFPDKRSNEVLRINFLRRTNLWSLENRRLIEQYVQTNAPALAKGREALNLSRFRYPVDYSYGTEAELPHLQQTKTLARIAVLQAALETEQGHADEWPQNIIFELNLAATLNGEPSVMGHLVRNGIISLACNSTERCLNRASPNDESCKALQEAFAMAGSTNTLPLALVGERALMLPAFRMSITEMREMGESEEDHSHSRERHRLSGKAAGLLWASGFFERDGNFYLQTMERGISLAVLPPPESLKSTNLFYDMGKVAQKKLYVFSGLLMPTLSRLATRDAITQAQIRLATTALAIERFRRAEGRLPNELKELTPRFLDAVPADPFDGALLRFRRLAKGYLIYSIGADGHDDGGRERPEQIKSGDNTSYDLTFTVESH